MPSFDSVALFIVLAVMAAVGVWALYTIVENAPIAKEDKPGDLPYKVDPPHTTTTVELAIPATTYKVSDVPVPDKQPKPKRKRKAAKKKAVRKPAAKRKSKWH